MCKIRTYWAPPLPIRHWPRPALWPGCVEGLRSRSQRASGARGYVLRVTGRSIEKRKGSGTCPGNLEGALGGGGVWDPKDCVPRMAPPDFPLINFGFFPRWSLWSGGCLRCTAILILPWSQTCGPNPVTLYNKMGRQGTGWGEGRAAYGNRAPSPPPSAAVVQCFGQEIAMPQKKDGGGV